MNTAARGLSMLTRKQRDLLVYINDYIGENGVSPSFDEMKEALDLKSKSGIHRLINALVERGFLIRMPNKARALEVKRLPDAAAGKPTVTAIDTFSDTRAASKPTGVGIRPHAPANSNDVVELPLKGKIAAGTPIDAISHDSETITVPASFLGARECYALTIEGDSMTKAGIMDGDVVIIERCDTARDGDIVVALVDDAEVTLKRLRREIGTVILQPENDAYQPIRLAPDRVKIQGKIRSLLRNY